MGRRWMRAAVLLGLLAAMPSAWAFEPHRSYTTTTKTLNTTDAQTDATLWTPASGKAIAIQGCDVSADATQTALLEIGSTAVHQVLYIAANGNAQVGGGYAPFYMTATDDVLTYTTSTSANTSVTCWGYEFQR